jgi:hypothetical protein
MFNHNASSNANRDGSKMSMYVEISSQADRVTGGRFNDQNVPTLAVDEVPRVPDTLRGEEMIWTMPKGIEAEVKSLGDNKSEMMFATDLAAGRVLGVEVVKSLNMTQGTAILVDASNVAIGIDPTEFSVSEIAAITEASADTTVPTMAGDAAGAAKPGAVGTAGQVPQDGGIPLSGGVGAARGTAPVPEARSLWQTLTYFVASFCGNAVDQLRELLGTPSWTISSQAI